jgi:glycolate oxidase FAD binding subunit
VRIIASTLEPTILDIMSLRTGGLYVMTIRFETEPEAADEQAATLVNMATGLNDTQIIQGEAEESLWQQAARDFLLASDASNALIIKASILPTDVVSWLASLEQTVEQKSLNLRWRAHAGHGLIFARLAGDEDALVSAVTQLRSAASTTQGSLVVLDAAPALASRVDVWGSLPTQTFEVMRRLKLRFDPNYALNPGRFVGGL